ncbi:hypothetical protein GCM10027176_56010 [Actinoallomurus bryophytorum]|uniref:hypothetical protein n=1 Tax=Actinoallomurus bryophytorum TaxID=1490222 RepID=UPI00319E5117
MHHGSSISHCCEAEGPLGTWPVVAARLAGADLLNLGLAGNAMVDHFTARTIRDRPADLISLKLGINVVNGDTLRPRTSTISTAPDSSGPSISLTACTPTPPATGGWVSASRLCSAPISGPARHDRLSRCPDR